MTLLVATDFSEGAATALNYASVQPEATDGLVVHHVIDDLGRRGGDRSELWTLLVESPGDLEERLLEERMSRVSSWTYESYLYEDVDLPTTFRVTIGKASDEINGVALEHGATRIICGAIGKGHSAWHSVGTTALRIAAAGKVPVTLVRSSNSLKPRVFLVPYDFSERSDAALDYAHDRAKKIGASVHILNAVPVPSVSMISAPIVSIRQDVVDARTKRLETRVENFEVPVEIEFSVEPPHIAISQAAHRLLDSEIVMSSRGHGKIGRLAIGSVAERVLREADRPVTLVPFEDD